MRSHRRITISKSISVAVTAATLGSCSDAYDVKAIVISGKLAFVSNDPAYQCVANISVATDEKVEGVPTPRLDRQPMTKGGEFWRTNNPVGGCRMGFPIIYGPNGPHDGNRGRPKKLHAEITYRVETEGVGAYGFGCFRISAALKVANLPQERCSELAPSLLEPASKG